MDYTIILRPKDEVIQAGKLKGARLYFSAPGLRFFVTAGMTKTRYDVVGNLAIRKAQEHGVAAIDVKRVLRECGCEKKKESVEKSKQLKLF